MITVTRPWLPSREKLDAYIDKIYSSGQLTNNGELVRDLESRLAEFLGVKHLILVANGTSALQVAYHALDLSGEVITTPFTFVATASSMVWQGLQPKFSDICPATFTLDPALIQAQISPRTCAIVPVHVFGNPCYVEKLAQIAKYNKVKLIYDASHCFGVKYKGQSLLRYGDASTLSFHATKLFHTCEGGAVITDNDELAQTLRNKINFGITGPSQIQLLGVNAKMNELEAAMGHAVLDDIQISMNMRQRQVERYRHELYSLVSDGLIRMQRITDATTENYAYFPIVCRSEAAVLELERAFKEASIFTRRYFHPSLDTLSFLSSATEPCTVSQHVAKRVLCLPLYAGLSDSEQQQIISIIKKVSRTHL